MELGFLARMRHHAEARPRHPALLADGLMLTYEALALRAAAIGAALQERGAGPGAVVGLTLADEVDHFIATLAVLAAGAGQIVLASHDAPALRASIARKAGVTHVLGDGGAGSDLALDGCRVLAWPALKEAKARSRGTPAAGAAAASALIYLKTSGTTGEMNLVAFTEADLAAQAERHPEYRDERLLRLASIEHNNSKRHRLYCAWAGGSNVFRGTGADLAALVARHAVSCLDISRMHAADLVASGSLPALAGLKLRTGGSAIPAVLRRALEDGVGARLYVRYAATECGAIAMAGPGEHDADASAGRPLAGVELQIVDSGGAPLPAGQSGEIRLRAAGMAKGYVGAPEQSASRFRDGWFHPGDCGTLRADGQLVVLGRRDDMIVMNGLNIFPAEIERVLEQHPAVCEAAAFALPSTVHGQIPVAAVQLRAGVQASAAELQSFGRGQLGLRTPRRIVVLAELPRNSQGKTVKARLAPYFQHAGADRDGR